MIATNIRYIIALLLLTAVSLNSYGQPNLARGDGESEALYQLHAQARKLVNSDPDSAYSLITEIRNKSEAAMPYTFAETHITEGLGKMTEGKWTEAELLFRNALPLFRKLGDSLCVAKTLDFLGYSLQNQGFLDKHLELQMQVLNYRLRFGDKPNLIARSYSAIGSIYSRVGELTQAMEQYQKTLEIRKGIPGLEPHQHGFTLRNIGKVLVKEKKYDEAVVYYQMALDSFRMSNNKQFILQTNQLLGKLFLETRELSLSKQHFDEAFRLAEQMNSVAQRGQILLDLAKIYHLQSDDLKALQTLENATIYLEESNTKPGLRDAYKLMATIHEKLANPNEALHYFKAHLTIKDTLSITESSRKIAELRAKNKLEQKEQEIELLENKQQQDKLIRLLLLLALCLALGTIFFVFQANAKRKKAYKALLVEKKKAEQLYQDLQQVQRQLIQSEKMASLGQFTAGIAHEINNPINFINVSSDALQLDFEDLQQFLNAFLQLEKEAIHSAEVINLIEQAKEIDVPFLSTEITELVASIKEGVVRVTEIVNGLKTFTHQSTGAFKAENLQLILKSALAILKNKVKTKEIEVTINAEAILNVPCQAGKISQVFVNVIDNAIEAMNVSGLLNIKLFTQNDQVLIEIQDNGTGIEKNTLNHVFDPFYTTKEVGQGTGLGMAISYGIIKGHGGEITIESTIGQGTLVRIALPVNSP